MDLKFLITRILYENKKIPQREIADNLQISLGKTNQVMKELISEKIIVKEEDSKGKSLGFSITDTGIKLLEKNKVDGAVLFASGKGMRLAPLNYDIPKPLIEIKGEIMIERQIQQLKAVGIDDIVIVVGYMKEKFEYLIDKYNIRLVYNGEYQDKNTLATMYHAKEYIKNRNCYICVCDIYSEVNLFHKYECEPYYTGAFAHDIGSEWKFICNSKNQMTGISEGGKDSYYMVGPAFFTKEFSKKFLELIEKYYNNDASSYYYWEDVLIKNLDSLPSFYVHKIKSGIIHEFDSMLDIKKFNETIDNDKIYDPILKYFSCERKDLSKIELTSERGTSKFYKFMYKNKYYMVRVPKENVNDLIDRSIEKNILKKLADTDFVLKVLFIDEKTGYKISEYIDNGHMPDPNDKKDEKIIMDTYIKLHTSGVEIAETSDIIKKIDECMDIIKNQQINILYADFDLMYENMCIIKKYISSMKRPRVLTNGNPSPYNIVIKDEKGVFIDFEYGGMTDPISDIALYGIYVKYNINETIRLLKYYVKSYNELPENIRNKYKDIIANDEKTMENILIAYMALGGFYSAIWVIIRENMHNIDYGEYGMSEYRIFKECFKYLKDTGII